VVKLEGLVVVAEEVAAAAVGLQEELGIAAAALELLDLPEQLDSAVDYMDSAEAVAEDIHYYYIAARLLGRTDLELPGIGIYQKLQLATSRTERK
jgi:hypothetical protein